MCGVQDKHVQMPLFYHLFQLITINCIVYFFPIRQERIHQVQKRNTNCKYDFKKSKKSTNPEVLFCCFCTLQSKSSVCYSLNVLMLFLHGCLQPRSVGKHNHPLYKFCLTLTCMRKRRKEICHFNLSKVFSDPRGKDRKWE